MRNSSLVSGLSEASGVRFSWVEVSQESPTISEKSAEIRRIGRRPPGAREPGLPRVRARMAGRVARGPVRLPEAGSLQAASDLQ